MAESEKTVEIIIALVIVVASFMYIYDALTRSSNLDLLFAVLVFGGGLIYLFNHAMRK